jgi:hypothetical protein
VKATGLQRENITPRQIIKAASNVLNDMEKQVAQPY